MISLHLFRPHAPSTSRRTVRRLAVSLALVVSLLAGSTALAAGKGQGGGGTPSPSPVEVTNIVDVIGAVDIVGESHKQPFFASQSVTLPANQYNKHAAITVPEGQRVIIESISVISYVPAGAKAWGVVSASSSADGNYAVLGCSFTEQGAYYNETVFTSTTPTSIRLEGGKHTLQSNIFRSGSSAEARYQLSVFGYMEDL